LMSASGITTPSCAAPKVKYFAFRLPRPRSTSTLPPSATPPGVRSAVRMDAFENSPVSFRDEIMRASFFVCEAYMHHTVHRECAHEHAQPT
jgi:hypothetical protein